MRFFKLLAVFAAIISLPAWAGYWSVNGVTVSDRDSITVVEGQSVAVAFLWNGDLSRRVAAHASLRGHGENWDDSTSQLTFNPKVWRSGRRAVRTQRIDRSFRNVPGALEVLEASGALSFTFTVERLGYDREVWMRLIARDETGTTRIWVNLQITPLSVELSSAVEPSAGLLNASAGTILDDAVGVRITNPYSDRTFTLQSVNVLATGNPMEGSLLQALQENLQPFGASEEVLYGSTAQGIFTLDDLQGFTLEPGESRMFWVALNIHPDALPGIGILQVVAASGSVGGTPATILFGGSQLSPDNPGPASGAINVLASP